MATAEEIRAALEPFWSTTGTSATPTFTATDAVDDHSAFRTGLAASTSVAAVLASVAELAREPIARLDQSLALASFTTHARVDGEPLPKWASLSGFYLNVRYQIIVLPFFAFAVGVFLSQWKTPSQTQ